MHLLFHSNNNHDIKLNNSQKTPSDAEGHI